MRYKKELSEKNKIRNELQKEHDKLKKRLTELSLEVGKSLCGENKFPVDVLAMSINSTKTAIENIDKKIAECDRALEEKSEVISKLDYYYEQFITWANEFDKATQEQRKMIICQLIDEINVICLMRLIPHFICRIIL